MRRSRGVLAFRSGRPRFDGERLESLLFCSTQTVATPRQQVQRTAIARRCHQYRSRWVRSNGRVMNRCLRLVHGRDRLPLVAIQPADEDGEHHVQSRRADRRASLQCTQSRSLASPFVLGVVLSDSSVCHILGWRYLARLLRSVVKSETPDQTTVDRVILSDEPADLAGTSHSSL